MTNQLVSAGYQKTNQAVNVGIETAKKKGFFGNKNTDNIVIIQNKNSKSFLYEYKFVFACLFVMNCMIGKS